MRELRLNYASASRFAWRCRRVWENTMSEDINHENVDEGPSQKSSNPQAEAAEGIDLTQEKHGVEQIALEDLKKQLAVLGASIETRLVVDGTKRAKMWKRSIAAVALVGVISVGSLIASLYNLSTNSNMRSTTLALEERIESFVLMDSLIGKLREDIDLAGITSASLENQILGFEGVLDIALQQMWLRLDEHRNGLDIQVQELKHTVAGFDEKFGVLSDSNRAMSLEIRRVIQSNAQLEELEKTLNAIVVLEREKYYELVSSRMKEDQNSVSEDLE